MENLLMRLRNNRMFFSGFLLVLRTGFFSLLICGKTATFISLNNYHPFWLNVFFINYTFFGDGIFAISIIAACYFYFKKKQQALALLYAFLLSGLAVQVIKNLVNSPRPKLFFEHGQYLHFIQNVSLSGYASFPSGHTTTAFAFATVLILTLKNKNWQLPLLFAAVLAGYSRIYLAQHFLIDVLAGALIGCITAFPAVYLAQNTRHIKQSFKKLHKIEKGSAVQSPSLV